MYMQEMHTGHLKNVPEILTINYKKIEQASGMCFGMNVNIISLHIHTKIPISD